MGDRDETRSKKGVIVFVNTKPKVEGVIDLDALDRLHASLPELEPTSWLDADENDAALVIATVIAEDDYDVDVAAERAHDAVTILRAYPALSAEVRALRKVSQDRYAEAIADVVAWLRRKHDHGDVLDRVIDGIEDCAHVGAAKEG